MKVVHRGEEVVLIEEGISRADSLSIIIRKISRASQKRLNFATNIGQQSIIKMKTYIAKKIVQYNTMPIITLRHPV